MGGSWRFGTFGGVGTCRRCWGPVFRLRRCVSRSWAEVRLSIACLFVVARGRRGTGEAWRDLCSQVTGKNLFDGRLSAFGKLPHG